MKGGFRRKKVALANTHTRTRAVKEQVIDLALPLHIVCRLGCDIFGLDEQVRKRLGYMPTHVQSLQHKADTLAEEIEQVNSVARLRTLEMEHAKLMAEIHQLTRDATLENYLKESAMILSQINKLSTEVCVLDVMAKDYHDQLNREQLEERLMDQYFNIVRKYVPITVEKEKRTVETVHCCFSCGCSLNDIVVGRSGYRHCPNIACGTDNKVPRANIPLKEYDVLGNFLKAFRRYMAVQPVRFNIEVMMVDLDRYFVEQGLPDGAYYRNQPVNEEGKKDGTDHTIITEALEHLGYTDFYKDWMFIGHHYYGWRLPPIRHLQDIIKRNFTITQNEWKKLPPSLKEGSSSLPTQYRLCQELRRADPTHMYLYKSSGFRLPHQLDTIERYDRVYERMSKAAGFTFIPILKGDLDETYPTEGENP